jgi:GPH family glycoside/pentoside/hexuronide:cation symporter
MLGALLAGLILFFGLTCIVGLAPIAPKLRATSQHETEAGFFRDMVQLGKNKAFMNLLLGGVIVLMSQGLLLSLNLHAFRYFWELDADTLTLPLTLIPIGMAVGIPVAGFLLRYLEKRDLLIGGVAIFAAYSLLIPLAVIFGWVDRGGEVATALVIAHAVVLGLVGAACFICLYSMMADAVDEHALLFGVRREALFAAGLLLGTKAAAGVGGLIAGAGLQIIGFPADTSTIAPGELSPSVVDGIGYLWGPGMALLCFAGLPFFLRYHINRKHHEEVVASLAQRARAPSSG